VHIFPCTDKPSTSEIVEPKCPIQLSMPSGLEVGYIASETGQRGKGQEKPRLQPRSNFRGQSSSLIFYSYIFYFTVSVPTDQDKAYGARRPSLHIRSPKRRGAPFSGSSTRLRKSPNAFKISGITPEELENEVLTGPEAVAEAECHLIQNVISHLGSFRTDSQQPYYLGLGGPDD
jgi:hypothetical protein